MALTLAAFVLIFLAIRHAVVPRTFGDLGHYRAAALDDIRARPVSFAGKAVCETCHDDVMKTKSEGKHAGVACEACHGPTSAHTEDPMTNHAVKPNPATLCVRCHEADPAKPKTFPQVISKEHAGELSCAECHQPHSPKP
ncbi:MAG: cytochrome c3 family protein [Bryobacteraceae bacterium]